MLNKLRAECNWVISSTDQNEEAVTKADKQLLEVTRPNIWNVNMTGNMETVMEVDFDKTLVSISIHAKQNVDDITVFRYFSILDYLQEQNRNAGSNN